MVDNDKTKKMVIIFWMTFAIAVAVFVWIFISINNKFKESSDLGLLTINTTEDVVPNDYNLVSASSTQDKTINEVQNNIVVNQIATGKVANLSSSKTSSSENKVVSQTSKQENTVITQEPKVEEKKELSFIAPVVRRNYNRLCK